MVVVVELARSFAAAVVARVERDMMDWVVKASEPLKIRAATTRTVVKRELLEIIVGKYFTTGDEILLLLSSREYRTTTNLMNYLPTELFSCDVSHDVVSLLLF